jgi:hypothetical protein
MVMCTIQVFKSINQSINQSVNQSYLSTEATDEIEDVLWVVAADDVVDGFVPRHTAASPIIVAAWAVTATAPWR